MRNKVNQRILAPMIEFRHWKTALQAYKDLSQTNPNVYLVISTQSYTSGYWLEQCTKEQAKESTSNTQYYYTGKQVALLFERVEREEKEAAKEGRSSRLIL